MASTRAMVGNCNMITGKGETSVNPLYLRTNETAPVELKLNPTGSEATRWILSVIVVRALE
jgi:hypothetical protein